MDPATILSVVGASSKLAKTAWDLGEALYTFTKDAKIINKTLAALIAQTRAVRDPCELLALFLTGVKQDLEAHPDWAATRHGQQLSDTMEVVQRQIDGCETTLDELYKSTEGIRGSDTNSAKKAWATFKFNLRKDTMKECRSQLDLHLTALNTSLHILNCNIIFLAHEPQQPIDDLAEGIEALREQTNALQSQPPTLSESPELNKLLILGQETVADGETIYAESVAGGSVLGHNSGSVQPASIFAWLHQQVFEAGQRSLDPISEHDDLYDGSSQTHDREPQAAGLPQPDQDATPEILDENDDELEFERNFISSLIDRARILFDEENYQDARLKLENAIASMRDLPSDARGTHDVFELQYMIAVAAFYTIERKKAQRHLLDFVRQEAFTDSQRLHIAHASQLLAETYVNAGNLEAAKSSCANAIRIHRHLSGGTQQAKDNCFALAARIETLFGNRDKAAAYADNINANAKKICMHRYANLTAEKSLANEQRQALLVAFGNSFENFKLDEESGRIRLEASTSALRFQEVTPLHFAVMCRDTDYASALIDDGAEIDAQAHYSRHLFRLQKWRELPNRSWTPLACAVILGHKNMIRLLVSKGASLSCSKKLSNFCPSPLLALVNNRSHVAVDVSASDSVLDCVKHLGWDINTPIDNQGHRILHIAAEYGNVALVQSAISHGSELTKTDKTGLTALHHAACEGSYGVNALIKIANILLEHEKPKQLASRDKHGKTILHYAVQSYAGESRILIRPDEAAKLVQFLIASGSDVLAKDNNGNIPLALSRNDLHLRTSQLLSVKKHEQLSSRNIEGETPLHSIVNREVVGGIIVRGLLNADADLCAKDRFGGTPIQVLIKKHWPRPEMDDSWYHAWNLICEDRRAHDEYLKDDAYVKKDDYQKMMKLLAKNLERIKAKDLERLEADYSGLPARNSTWRDRLGRVREIF